MRRSSWRTASSRSSIPHGPCACAATDLLTLQVDGTKGSAVAGLRDCVVQHESGTPRPTWNPDIDSPIKFFEGWNRVPDYQLFDNAFKIQWEMFLRHVVKGRTVAIHSA